MAAACFEKEDRQERGASTKSWKDLFNSWDTTFQPHFKSAIGYHIEFGTNLKNFQNAK